MPAPPATRRARSSKRVVRTTHVERATKRARCADTRLSAVHTPSPETWSRRPPLTAGAAAHRGEHRAELRIQLSKISPRCWRARRRVSIERTGADAPRRRPRVGGPQPRRRRCGGSSRIFLPFALDDSAPACPGIIFIRSLLRRLPRTPAHGRCHALFSATPRAASSAPCPDRRRLHETVAPSKPIPLRAHCQAFALCSNAASSSRARHRAPRPPRLKIARIRPFVSPTSGTLNTRDRDRDAPRCDKN